MRVLTWNLHSGHGGQALGQAAQIKASGADLVLLQEVVGGDNHTAVLAAGWEHVAFARARGRIGGGMQGNLLLSRMAITAHATHNLSNNPWERRAALHAVLADGSHVFVVHLDLTGPGRRRQLNRLHDVIASDVPAGARLLLAGDCNDWSHDLDRRLVEAGYIDAHHEVHGRTARTWPARAALLALDRIYLRGWQAVSAHRLSAHGLSDHHGLIANLLPQSVAPEPRA